MKENSATIDYGIDLGNHRSYIAKVDGNKTTVIPNIFDNDDSISSAVYIKKNGAFIIGKKAKNKIAVDPKNGCAEFKLRMGSDYIYEFEKSGLKMTPVELSAEILKSIKKSLSEICDKNLKAAVITVPADFTPLQVKATNDAAELAGIDQVILLQEPTAAAIAYGFDNSIDNEMCLIYNFGESQFDLSILQKLADEIVNINYKSDKYLNGRIIDWDIVKKIFIPAIVDELELTDFNISNPKYSKQFAKLKKAAEEAKIDLSYRDSVEVEIENFIITDDGELFDFEYDLEKEELDEVMKPHINRSIDYCKKALDEINLTKDSLSKIILVGASTLSPYILERLSEEFNVPLEYSIDPATVVVRGAAIYAGTKLINEENTGGECSFVEKDGIDERKELNEKYVELLLRFTPLKERFEKIISNREFDSDTEIQALLNMILDNEIIKNIETSLNTSENSILYLAEIIEKIDKLEDILNSIDLLIKDKKSPKELDDESFSDEKLDFIKGVSGIIGEEEKPLYTDNDKIKNLGLKDISLKESKKNIGFSDFDLMETKSASIKTGLVEDKSVGNFINDARSNINPKSNVMKFKEESKLYSQTNNPDILTRPAASYKVNGPYIYISFAHRDANLVFPDINRFNMQGYNVRYDEGISSGDDWLEEIENNIVNSSLFVVFLSNNAVESRNVRNEIALAISQNIPVLPIYLEETELKYGLKLRLISVQSILKYEVSDEQYVKMYIRAFKENGFNSLVADDFEEKTISDNLKAKTVTNNLEQMEYDVYISYSTKDIEIANKVCYILEQNGKYCWIAPRNIRPGENYKDEILDGIKSSEKFVLIGSKNSAESKFVMNELEIAFSNAKPIINFAVDEFESDNMNFLLSSALHIKAYPNPEDKLEDLVLMVFDLENPLNATKSKENRNGNRLFNALRFGRG